MKVASIVLNNFTHDNRVLKECITLQNNGYDVTVLAYHEPGLAEHEEVMGIKVHRIRLSSKSWSKNRILQVFKFIEFLYRVIKTHKHHDVYHCNDLNALPIGYIIKRFYNTGAKIVYDAHEYETERNGYSGLDKAVSRFLEKRLIRKADVLITVSDGIAQEYQRLYGRLPNLVMNCPMTQDIPSSDILRQELGIAEEAKIFIYQGVIAKGRGVEGILDAFKQIDDPNLIIVFMGFGVLEAKVKDAAKEYSNIYHRDPVSMSELLKYTASADFGLSLIENICLSYYYSLPNKFFEYVMAGLPVIATNLPEMARIVHEEKIGHTVDSNSAEAIGIAVREMAKKNKTDFQDALSNTAKQYCWEQQETRLLSLYAGLNIN
ncbi:glycosyltransferase family 4 protein [Flavobacteriales bacterium AH-315-E23]|nr:glycosyltransferase family 4 protein [Flavobacteriales bacterium AH-315-E23]